jgi:hypothetical protein
VSRVNAPLKVKILMWLSVENKVLTWDNGMKRGWIGPSRCTMCKVDEETTHRLFVSCFFTQKVVVEDSFALKFCI